MSKTNKRLEFRKRLGSYQEEFERVEPGTIKGMERWDRLHQYTQRHPVLGRIRQLAELLKEMRGVLR